MNVIYFSPHFPPNYFLFCVRLRELGVNVLGIGDAPYLSLHSDLRVSLNEYYRVNDMEDYDQILRAVGYFTHKYGKVERFESHNEYWLESDARIRTDFNIPGPELSEIQQAKYKSKMKNIFKSARIAAPRGIVAGPPASVREFVEEVGYPLIAKPNKGVGATQTFFIQNETDLDDFFNARPPIDYMVEEFIDADVMTFDGLTDADGNIVFYTSHKYCPNPMETVSKNLNHYYYSLRDIPQSIVDFGKKCVKAFNVRERFFHLEFFYRGEDEPIYALEMNLRPPGGLTTDMFNYACDIDIYREWANLVVFKRFTATNFERKYHTCYIGMKVGKNYLHSHDDIMRTFGHLIPHHQKIPSLFSAGMGFYGYIIRASHLHEMLEAVRFIHEIE